MAQVAKARRERQRLKIPALALLALVIFGMAVGCAYALTVLTIRLAGVTVLEFTDEARVEDVIILAEDTVMAVIAPTDSTVADATYEVRLYLDGSLTATANIVWTEDELSAGVKKLVVFTDLDLEDTTIITVEVVRVNG